MKGDFVCFEILRYLLFHFVDVKGHDLEPIVMANGFDDTTGILSMLQGNESGHVVNPGYIDRTIVFKFGYNVTLLPGFGEGYVKNMVS